MNFFTIGAILVGLSALFGYLNHRYLRLPHTIGLLVISLVASLVVIAIDLLLPFSQIAEITTAWLQQIDFNKTLMEGMLSFLLFAGGLHADFSAFRTRRITIAVLAFIGTFISTFIVAGILWYLLKIFDLEIPFIWAFVFGALISPTDPIAVLSILKRAGAPPSLETKIAGESLFNDGVGVVVFLVLLGLLGTSGSHGGEVSPAGVVGLFAQEAVGGVVFGLGLGWLAYRMLRSVDNYQVEVLLTLALVTGGYALAARLHFSGPLAMVAAGLLIGNRGRVLGMSESTREHLDTFWELIDEGLNAVLFLMIGLEVLVLTFTREFLVAGLVGIPLVLLARFTAVGLMVSLLRLRRSFPNKMLPHGRRAYFERNAYCADVSFKTCPDCPFFP